MEKQPQYEENPKHNQENEPITPKTGDLEVPETIETTPTMSREDEIALITEKDEQIRNELGKIPVEDMSRIDIAERGEVSFSKTTETKKPWWKKLALTGTFMLGGLGIGLGAGAKEVKDSSGARPLNDTLTKISTAPTERPNKIAFSLEHKEYKKTVLEGKTYIPTPDTTKEVYALSVTGTLKGAAAYAEIKTMVEKLGYTLEDVNTLDLVAQLHKEKLPDVISIKNSSKEDDDTQGREVITRNESGKRVAVSSYEETDVFPIINRLGNIAKVELKSINDLDMTYDYRILVSKKVVPEDSLASK